MQTQRLFIIACTLFCNLCIIINASANQTTLTTPCASPVEAKTITSDESLSPTEAPSPAPAPAPKDRSATPRRLDGRWVFGGSFGLGFGDYTNISVSPQIGYNWKGKLTLGGGFSYNHYKDNDYDYTLNYFGLNIYGRYHLIRYISVFVQPEVHRRWGTVNKEGTGSKVFPAMLVGGGFTLPTGGFGGMTLSVYYDVIQDRYSPYGNNPCLSIGYTFGF